eukprot:755441-Hanusia_phi.AAC.3
MRGRGRSVGWQTVVDAVNDILLKANEATSAACRKCFVQQETQFSPRAESFQEAEKWEISQLGVALIVLSKAHT